MTGPNPSSASRSARALQWISLARPLDAFGWLFLGGVWLRCLLIVFLSPFNNDSHGHLQHILFINEHLALPDSGYGHETWQPPLYYVIEAAMSFISEDPKFLQVLSLMSSLGTLWIARRLIYSETFLRTREAKLFATMIVCLLPQFVMFGLYLSNDSLAVFLGFCAFYIADRFRSNPTARRFVELVVVLALGLLTKGHFLAVGVILLPWACLCYWQHQRPPLSRVLALSMLTFAVLTVGCTKYIQNARIYGKPFVSNLDFGSSFVKAQQGTFKGVVSVFDVNVAKLVAAPTVDSSTLHSIPLLLYGTCWYQYIPESNFKGNLLRGPQWIGRYMHVIGILPTSIGAIGLFFFPIYYFKRLELRRIDFASATVLHLASLLVFLGAIAVVLKAFLQSDVWSVLQARSLFPAILGGFVLFDVGVEMLRTHVQGRGCKLWGWAFILGVVAYFGTEIVLQYSALG